ncbi:growth factor receptor-bound protein 14 isoform X2 [Neoarius graeffei]|uniref:growth factor receptor-bound protein 14 isoform X2 n=1 Tax=Neoarius graeffei TaxID=443677 RepID=UPI00298BE4F4|nr:growth factor receptor-bound protein 14 isoform X2 [Neoarius graeffei]
MSAMSDSLDELGTPNSLGEKAAIFREGKGNVSTLSGGDHALIALHSPYQPPGAVQNRTAATTAAAFCRGNRKYQQGEEMQMNMVQNPFPDLFHSECLLPWTKNSATQVIKVYSEDNSSRAVEVPSDITARDICQLFILKNHCIDDHSWTLIEHLAHLGIERIIEDHESVLEVQSNWGMDSDSRLYFRKNYAKYEFFKKPLTFLNSSTCPEIHGFLYSKEQGRKSWKKFYFVLRRSGLYFSNKGTSKEPRHLQFVAEFCDSDVYTLLSARKTHGAPTDYGFCIKPSKSSSARDLKLLCADVEQTRTCWITAMRLFKFGMQLYQNFIQPHQKQKNSPMRSISENSLVAMDFSGQRSRVIDNPSEALSVAVAEGLSWRRKSCHRLSHGSCSPSQSSLSNIAIHMAQPWFHSKLSRDEAHKLITQHGLIDGVFLLRDSQSNPKTFVLSLCHAQRIRHFQIVPVEDDGELFYSLDDGNTRFSDLLQLVEFYQLNRGVLPCKLKHHCARTTL